MRNGEHERKGRLCWEQEQLESCGDDGTLEKCGTKVHHARSFTRTGSPWWVERAIISSWLGHRGVKVVVQWHRFEEADAMFT